MFGRLRARVSRSQKKTHPDESKAEGALEKEPPLASEIDERVDGLLSHRCDDHCKTRDGPNDGGRSSLEGSALKASQRSPDKNTRVSGPKPRIPVTAARSTPCGIKKETLRILAHDGSGVGGSSSQPAGLQGNPTGATASPFGTATSCAAGGFLGAPMAAAGARSLSSTTNADAAVNRSATETAAVYGRGSVEHVLSAAAASSDDNNSYSLITWGTRNSMRFRNEAA